MWTKSVSTKPSAREREYPPQPSIKPPRHGAEISERLPLVLEAVRQNSHLERLPLVLAGDDRSRQRKPLIPSDADGCRRGTLGRRGGHGFRFGRRHPQVGIIGQFVGSLAGTLRQVALGHGLNLPGDSFDEPGLVRGGRTKGTLFELAINRLTARQGTARLASCFRSPRKLTTPAAFLSVLPMGFERDDVQRDSLTRRISNVTQQALPRLPRQLWACGANE